jgi:membrane protein implicated in regulation of membrane protease activity
MAPLDMIVLKFSFTLMSGTGFETIQGLSNWVYGMASAVLLIWVPYQLYGASQAAVGQAYAITRSVKGRVKQHRQTKRRKQRKQRRQRYRRRQERKWDQYRKERLAQPNRPKHRGGEHE